MNTLRALRVAYHRRSGITRDLQIDRIENPKVRNGKTRFLLYRASARFWPVYILQYPSCPDLRFNFHSTSSKVYLIRNLNPNICLEIVLLFRGYCQRSSSGFEMVYYADAAAFKCIESLSGMKFVVDFSRPYKSVLKMRLQIKSGELLDGNSKIIKSPLHI